MQYTLKRYKRSRNVRIRVDHGGRVVVSAPIITPKKVVDVFVEKNLSWIKRQKEKLSYTQLAYPVVDWDKQMLLYLGRLYPIRNNNDQSELVNVSNRVMWINPPINNSKTIRKMVLQWIKQQARIEIFRRVRKWSEKMNVSYKSVRIAQQKSRWGSCSTTGTLSFNWRLVHFSAEVIDYVVIHELAHRIHPNHSRSFWETVKKYDPYYKTKVSYLKKQKVNIEDV